MEYIQLLWHRRFHLPDNEQHKTPKSCIKKRFPHGYFVCSETEIRFIEAAVLCTCCSIACKSNLAGREGRRLWRIESAVVKPVVPPLLAVATLESSSSFCLLLLPPQLAPAPVSNLPRSKVPCVSKSYEKAWRKDHAGEVAN